MAEARSHKEIPRRARRDLGEGAWNLPLDFLVLPKFPSSAKEGEMVLGFPSPEALQRFLKGAASRGVTVLRSIPKLGLARVSLGNLEGLADLASDFPDDMEHSLNFLVRAPSPAIPFDADEVRAFGSGALDWLGVPEDNASWGNGVKVAILDTGVWTEHSAFEGLDITQVDLLEPEESIPGDYDGHGTAVASLIVGSTKYQRGIAPGSQLMSLRVLDGEGNGDTFTLAEGIVEAVDRGASVLSLSLGGGSDSFLLRKAVNYALDNGAVIVASAGNDGEGKVTYPAAYPEVIGVTAVDAGSRIADFSNTGDGVDIAAPGIGLKTAWLGGKSVGFSGTSASAPLVSGAVAGILSQEPRLSPAEVFELLANHSDDGYGAGPDALLGHGVLNLERVLERNQRGIYDLAVGGFNLSGPGPATSNKTFEISVENRGTEWISGATLDLDVDGQQKRFYIGSLKPGEVLTSEWFLTPEQTLNEAGTPVKAKVTPNGRTDSRPSNDTWSMKMKIP